jgi:rare lipoprotein A
MRIVWRPSVVCCLSLAAVAAGAGACSSSKPGNGGRYGTASPRLVDFHQPIPKGGGSYKVGAPYQIDGRWYLPQEDPSYDRTGLASYYAEDFHGRRTSNGEIFDMWALSAAHPTLPLPSLAYVTNLENGRTLLVRINDRGPYVKNRVIDLSRATARYLGVEGPGLARVRVRYAGPAPLSGDDRQEQRFLASRPWFQIKLARAPNDSR